MGADANIKTIQTVYDAFARGDVASIVDAVTDDVDWASDTSSTAAPWFGPHRGKDGVMQFFQQFGSEMDVQEFTPVSFAANESEVLTVVRFKSTRRANGATSSMNLHHWFQFNDGKISFYRGTEDTSQTEAAFAG